ncbi:N-alpha-acetyltransferase 30 [Bagarius yarrelli]|uniref:N-alpha-acetyltransferase 30 n=1 Tax=Bagarius yarrelli TaxID=175774 RepID=A0A556V015_BAGYA|nr:N-alpha-acetyltransferase 30 [Bagarius yarrelli]
MAEVPPGPNTLPASTAEILSLPVDGCSFLGNNERLDRGRGDVIAPGTEAQQATEPKGIAKLSQNSVHHLNSASPLHFPAQLNGISSHPQHDEHRDHKSAQNHVQHRVHKAGDCQHTAAEHVDSTDERGNRKLAYNNRDSSLPSNGVDFPGPPVITGPGCSDQLQSVNTGVKGELGRTVCHSECNENAEQLAGDGEWGLGQRGAGDEEAPLEDKIAKLSVSSTPAADHSPIVYVRYESELQMPDIIRLITKDLSEPYSIYTYRYFIHNWPQLCFLAMVEKNCVGAIVCKLDMHKKMFRRGYIAMLAVDSKFRRKGIGTNLVKKAIYAMVEGDCDEVVLETEITNKSALKLYENLGFVRDKRLFRYYLNGVDALRLKLWLR